MSKQLAIITKGDNEHLDYIADKLGLTLYNQTIWDEAQEQFDNGASEAEVRVDGLNYIIVTKED